MTALAGDAGIPDETEFATKPWLLLRHGLQYLGHHGTMSLYTRLSDQDRKHL
jgi:hypothetical protein